MTDIVERLRWDITNEPHIYSSSCPVCRDTRHDLAHKAADKIDALQTHKVILTAAVKELEAENARLRNQLDAARTGKALLALEAAEAENERLSAWKAEATTALNRWHELWLNLGSPGQLGVSQSAGVWAYINAEALALEAERNLCDQLAEALRAVKGDRPTAHSEAVWLALLAALAAYEAARKEGQ